MEEHIWNLMPLGYYARIQSVLGKYTNQKDGEDEEKIVVRNGLSNICILT